MPEINQKELLKHLCLEKVFHSFSFEYMFDSRAQRYGKALTWLKLMGIALPSLLGMLVLSYELIPSLLYWLKAFIGGVSIVLFMCSLYVAIFKLDDELPYSYESALSHSTFHERFKKLELFPPDELDKFKQEYDLLMAEVVARSHQDTKHNIKEWERRKGYRFALRQFEYECKGCQIIPKSMTSTDCDICGKFSPKYKYF